MRAAPRRASSASPERSDAYFYQIPFHVAGGAIDQTFPKLKTNDYPITDLPFKISIPADIDKPDGTCATGCT